MRPVVVTGILVVHDGMPWLKECLDSLALQTRPLDRLVIVDTGSTDDSITVAARHSQIRQVVGDVEVIPAPRESTFGGAVGRAVEHTTGGSASSGPDPGAQWLWLLHDDSAADPDALAQLIDAARRSVSVGVAGPKLVSWQDPSRLLEVGWVITRSGRRVGGPARGEPDQGQHDHRNDVLGVSTSGMLIRRDVFDTLGGFDPAFGQFRDDLDLCWRAQLAGYRVVVAPRARMREAAASMSGQRSAAFSAEAARRRDRRHGRQVALARCSLYAAPFLAIWIALVSLGSAAALLVAKRPRGAWAELGDLGSLANPGPPLAARWRSRGLRQVRRSDLRGLFASTRAGFGHTLDTIHEGVAAKPAWSDDRAGDASSWQDRPASDGDVLFEAPARRAGWAALRHPGLLAVLAATLLAAVAWRSLFKALIPTGPGLAGGELLPVSGDASGLWHSWLDGWHGAGLGNSLESAPYLPVLSAGAWALEHLPLIDVSTSSAGVAIAWLLAAAVPLSAWTAYLGARVVTQAPWPRGWAALAWASLATLTTAVAAGRVGAVVAHILLPLVAAGFACAVRRSASNLAIFGAALALAVTGAFNPSLTVLGALAALLLLVFGRGRTRLRAAILLIVPIALLGPWILRLVDNPLLLLTGPGLTVWQGAAAAPWQLALFHPGGPGSYPVLLSAPILLAGVVALTATPRETGSGTMTVLAVLTVIGLAAGLAAPRLIIGLVPQGLPGAGGPITVWPGTGLDLAALALIAASLRGLDRSAHRSWGLGHQVPSRSGRRRILVPAVAAAAVLAVMASMATAGWLGVGQALTRKGPDTPAVAADQADGPGASRLLDMSRDGGAISYRLVGAEVGSVVRDLPSTAPSPDPLLMAAVRKAAESSGVTSANAAGDALADLGVGFVGFRGASTDPLVAQLDATAGITRLGNNDGLTLWRVMPRGNAVAASRLRLEDVTGQPLASIATTGDHGQTDVSVGPAMVGASAGGRRLVVAEPARWSEHARVTFAGRRLQGVAGAVQPTYPLPSHAGRLEITLVPDHQWWRWAQLGLLLLALFLAAPFGATHSRGTP